MGSLATVALGRLVKDDLDGAVVIDWEEMLYLDLDLFARSSTHLCAVAHGDAARMRALDEARSPSWMDLLRSVRLELSRGACLNTRTLLGGESG